MHRHASRSGKGGSENGGEGALKTPQKGKRGGKLGTALWRSALLIKTKQNKTGQNAEENGGQKIVK